MHLAGSGYVHRYVRLKRETTSLIRYHYFPRTEPPPDFLAPLVDVFVGHESEISTEKRAKGLTSDAVLAVLADDLLDLGFEVERGKKQAQKIHRPVFFGEGGEATLKYEVDAYHSAWRCGLEIEAGRAWMGNAIYRDLIQAMVMSGVETLVLAVSNIYKYKGGPSHDYDNTIRVAEALYGHSRFALPYTLALVGY